MFDQLIKQSLALLQKSAIADDNLATADRDERISFIQKTKKDLEISFDETFNFIGLLGFWEAKPIRLIPIIESKVSGKRTPDYLSVYNGKRVLIECKSSSLNEIDDDRLSRRIQRGISSAKKQLATYPSLPGICIFQTDNEDTFEKLKSLRGYIQKKIDDDNSNLSAIVFTYRKDFKEDDENYPSVNLFDFVKAVEEFNNGNEKLLRKIIIPAEIISEVYSVVKVKKTRLEHLLTGKPILTADLKIKKEIKFEKEKIISVFSENKFVGMYKIVNEKEIFAKPEFVLQPI